jgi:hypothetical protein
VKPLRDGRGLCFVITQFVESAGKYNPGFFDDVCFAFKPAIEVGANVARTAKPSWRPTSRRLARRVGRAAVHVDP